MSDLVFFGYFLPGIVSTLIFSGCAVWTWRDGHDVMLKECLQATAMALCPVLNCAVIAIAIWFLVDHFWDSASDFTLVKGRAPQSSDSSSCGGSND